MTLDISATSPRVQYTVGSSSTTTFAYGFPIFQEADLKVYVDSTLKTLTTHYSITGEGTTSGGNVVFGSGLTNCTVTIFRDVEIARTTDFPTSGAFQVGSLNTELDTITAVQQELEDKITRSLRLDDEDGAVAMTLPLKANRIGKILGFNSSTGVPEMYVYLTNENTVALDGLTAGTVTESKYVLVDANKDIGSFRNVTLTGELDAGSLDVSGNADIDGTLEADAITVDGTALNEYIADTVGAMVTGTETGLAVSYDDSDNTLDFVLGTTHTTVTSLTNANLVVGYGSSHANIDFSTDNSIVFDIDGTSQIQLDDGVLKPTTDDDVDLGTSSLQFKDAYIHGTLEADAITVDGTALATYIRDTVGTNMLSNNTETGIAVSYDTTNDNIDFALEASQTVFTSITNTSLVIGRDADNDIDFATDNTILFRASGADQIKLVDGVLSPVTDADVDLGSSSLQFKDAYIHGTLEADAITIGGTTLSETIADTVGAMVGSNTETGISVDYDDSDNTLDFVIGAGSIVNSMLADDAVGADELASNAVVTASIVADAVTGAKIADDQIDSEHYVDGSIDTAHIASGAITADKIADGTVVAAEIASNAVTTVKINADAVTGAKIADNAIDSEHYTDGSIDLAHMSANSIDSSQYVDGSIDLVHMSANSVDSDQYVDGSIDLVHMSANSVDSDQYVDGSIDTAHIANDQITNALMADDAIDSSQLASGSVDLAHMSVNSIDSDQYVDGSIDTAHIGADQITSAKIADDQIDSEHIVAGAVDAEHMSANSIDSASYVDGSIDLAHMSANSIDSDQYVDGSIDLVHMSANSVDSDQYVDGSIDTAHVADNAVTLAKMAGLARGKLITGDSSGDPSALAIGTNGQYLKSDGSDLVWGSATVSGLACDDLTVGDGAVTVSTSAGNITIDAQGNDTDIIFKGTDNTSDITMLTLDGSDAGKLLPNNGIDLNGKELILDADADTSITADSDDQIDFRIGGSDQHKFGSEVVFNEQGADINFRVEGSGDANLFKVDAGDNKIYIGHGGDQAYDAGFTPVVQIAQVGNTVFGGLGLSHYSNDAEGAILVMGSGRATSVVGTTVVANGDTLGRIEFQGQDGGDFETGASIFGEVDGTPGANDMPGRLVFKTTADGAHSASERMRIHNSGDISIGRTTADTVNAGMTLEAVGTGVFVRDGGPCIITNRLSSDGEIIRINKDDTTIGTISVSGSDVDYGTFTGSHWSRLSDNSKPTILKGTVIESIDEMCDWYQAEYTSQEEEKYADGDDIPDDKEIGDVKKEKTVTKDSIALPSGKKVGDTITHTVDGVDYTAKILQEEDIKHTKCKVSDSADSKCVYGVFLTWDDDGDIVNDMRIAALGTYVVRIHKDQTVAKGDLLSSNGDGTAKKQDDDIIRSKTIGKVLTNIKQETYDDGSYIVPCALYCG